MNRRVLNSRGSLGGSQRRNNYGNNRRSGIHGYDVNGGPRGRIGIRVFFMSDRSFLEFRKLSNNIFQKRRSKNGL